MATPWRETLRSFGNRRLGVMAFLGFSSDVLEILSHPGSHFLKLFNDAERLVVVTPFHFLIGEEPIGVRAFRRELLKPLQKRLQPVQLLR